MRKVLLMSQEHALQVSIALPCVHALLMHSSCVDQVIPVSGLATTPSAGLAKYGGPNEICTSIPHQSETNTTKLIAVPGVCMEAHVHTTLMLQQIFQCLVQIQVNGPGLLIIELFCLCLACLPVIMTCSCSCACHNRHILTFIRNPDFPIPKQQVQLQGHLGLPTPWSRRSPHNLCLKVLLQLKFPVTLSQRGCKLALAAGCRALGTGLVKIAEQYFSLAIYVQSICGACFDRDGATCVLCSIDIV